MTSEFIHLHNHSDYSLLDGAQNINTFLGTLSDLGMDSAAITEHGNMFSAIKFYQTAKKHSIKPIIGCEIYVAHGERFKKERTAEGGWGNNHLVLLAQNNTGYKNLMKLVTHGYLEGFYYRPRIDMELLQTYSEGLICLSSCLKGIVPEKMLRGDWAGARESALNFQEIFQDRYYLEIQNHNLPEEQKNIENMKKLSRELDLPLVATNDCHYALSKHADAHDIHICLGTGKDRNDPRRLKYATPEFYIKSQDEMFKLFKDIPEALENTRRIADSVNIELDMDSYHLPKFTMPEHSGTGDPDEYLRNLSEAGVAGRYSEITPDLRKRMDHELGVIKRMGFAGYFLITSDFVRYAKDNRIPVGPGRGSAAGSLVSYALGITDIDPIKHNLLFERFLNPDRISMPDIDIDFCIDRRSEVINYIKKQYGENSVTQIITFGKMKAKQVVRDVGRVMGYSFSEVDKLAKAIPDELNISLEDSLEKSPELKEMAETEFSELMDYARVLEGMNRHASTHAAGVVIAPGDLTDYVPLYKQSGRDEITSQYDMKDLESLGLLKMDFLGLRNLTVINRAVSLIGDRGVTVDINNLDMEDQKVYELFAKGLTTGIFQFESSGMREFLKKLKPTVIDDLIAMNALYRPGPMQNINDFIERKHGRKKITYLHPDMEPILKETYGIIVYQEQVMQIANKLAGFTLAQADSLRKAVGKKIGSLMEQNKVQFIEGAMNNGIRERKAREIFDLIEKFAQYGFNKSHSVAYAYIAYQTAWLKTYHPAEFLSATLTSEMSNSDRIVILINDSRKMGIEVLPPDINVSNIDFRPVGEKRISFGLNAIKNVGARALETIIKSRRTKGEFTSIFDFCGSVELRAVNRKVLESLIKAGALDSLEGSRARKYEAIDIALKYGQQLQNNLNHDQVDMFGNSVSGDNTVVKIPDLPPAREWTEQEVLENEKEVVGLYLSGHPLLKHADDLEEISNFDFTESVNAKLLQTVRIGGIVNNVKRHFDRKGNTMAFFNLECLGGQAEILVFSDAFSRYEEYVMDGKIVFISGKPTDPSSFTDLKLIADEIIPLESGRDHFSKKVNIRIIDQSASSADIEEIYDLARKYHGKSKLVFHVQNGEKRFRKIFAHNISVSSHKQFLNDLRKRFGKENIWLE